MLAFKEITYCHAGKAIAANVLAVINYYDLGDKIGFFVLDNALSNDFCLSESLISPASRLPRSLFSNLLGLLLLPHRPGRNPCLEPYLLLLCLCLSCLLRKPDCLSFLELYLLLLELLELLTITCLLHLPRRLEYNSTLVLLRFLK
jgi:hypothetical protein